MAFFNNSTVSNWTTLPMSHSPPKWSIVLFIRIAIAVSSFSLNVALFALHLIKPSYITHFTIYLLFLYIANTVYLAGSQPLQFLSDIRGMDVASYGSSACHFYSYTQRTVSIIPVMAHVLIAVNRLWAVQYPITYRNRHTIKMATLICIAMACYVHILCLPAFFANWPNRYYRDASGNVKCEGRQSVAMMHWSRADSCVNRFVPLFIIIGSYMYIIVKRWSKKRNQVVANSSSSGTRNRNQLARVGTATGSLAAEGQSMTVPENPRANRKAVKNATLTLHKKVVKPFLILTMTTAGVIVCWLPLDIIYFCILFLNIPIGPAVSGAFHMLYTVQLLFDPLMWLFSLRKS